MYLGTFPEVQEQASWMSQRPWVDCTFWCDPFLCYLHDSSFRRLHVVIMFLCM